VVIQPMLVV